MAKNNSIKKTDLGYLGENFQNQLVKYFIEVPSFFASIAPIVDQNMFTDQHLRRIVGVMKDRYNKIGTCPTYVDIELILSSEINEEIYREEVLTKLSELKTITLSGADLIRENAEKFFKQQNLAKAINKCMEILRRGNSESYYEMEDLIKKALNTNMMQENGFRLFETIDEDLRDDYRKTVPTGADELDKSLYGGLGKGELGVIISPLGTGKAQPLYSRILTPTGYKTMGEIEIGDYVIGGDGKKHKVIGTFPQGLRPVYKVEFTNGTTCECDINHLWSVNTRSRRTRKNYIRNSEGILERIHNPDWSFKTVSLQEIINKGLKRKNQKGEEKEYIFHIPTCKPIEFDEQEIHFDPYLFGRNVLNIDFIPQEYLYNSLDVRISLLQGLLDSKGHIKKSGVIYFNTRSKQICNDIKFIVCSLGGNVKIKNEKDKYRINISLSGKIIPFRLKEKIERYRPRVKYLNQTCFKSIEYKGQEETKCILIDSDEHTYITEDFIVTHNTSCTTGFAAHAATAPSKENDFKGFKVLHFFFEDTEVNIRRKYYGYLTNIEACDLSKPEFREHALAMLKDTSNKMRKMMHDNIIAKRLVSGEVTASDIKYMIQQYISLGFIPDLVIIDYFECLKYEKTDNQNNSEWTQEGVTMRKLEAIANEFNVALWVPVQSTKGAIGQEFVGVSDGGGSVKKMQIGHVIITLAQTKEQKMEGKMNLHIGKQRAVKVGRTIFNNVKFNNGTCKFDFSEIDSIDNEPVGLQANSQSFQKLSKNIARSTK